jgi:hypothetical protein
MLRNGCAARCKAVALPRRDRVFESRGYAPGGAAPFLEDSLTEGHSRFLTSGDEAVAQESCTENKKLSVCFIKQCLQFRFLVRLSGINPRSQILKTVDTRVESPWLTDACFSETMLFTSR